MTWGDQVRPLKRPSRSACMLRDLSLLLLKHQGSELELLLRNRTAALFLAVSIANLIALGYVNGV